MDGAVGFPDPEGEIPFQVQGKGGAGLPALLDGDLLAQNQGAAPVICKEGFIF